MTSTTVVEKLKQIGHYIKSNSLALGVLAWGLTLGVVTFLIVDSLPGDGNIHDYLFHSSAGQQLFKFLIFYIGMNLIVGFLGMLYVTIKIHDRLATIRQVVGDKLDRNYLIMEKAAGKRGGVTDTCRYCSIKAQIKNGTAVCPHQGQDCPF